MMLFISRHRQLGMILILSLTSFAHSQTYPTTLPLAPDNSTSQANCTFNPDPNELPPPVWWQSLPAAPKCAWESCPTVFNSCCSATKCTETFIGACMRQATLINRECGCPDFSADGCATCTDNALGRAEYYRWLNMTCGDIKGWDGLPKDWTKTNSSLDLFLLGYGTTCKDNRYYPCPKCGIENSYYGLYYCADGTSSYHMLLNAGYLSPELNMPPCVWQDCPIIWEQYNASLVTKTDFGFLDLDPAITADRLDTALYLERSFCSTISHQTCPGMCASPSEQTELLLWLNNTCGTFPSFQGLPSNWTTIVAAGSILPDSPEAISLNLQPPDRITQAFPSCISDTCQQTLMLNVNNTNQDYCQLDPSGKFCSKNNTLLSIPTFCSSLSYPTTCPDSCLLAFERPTWLSFLNTTCSPSSSPANSNFTGLPSNWTTLLSVIPSDLRPWAEVVSPDYYSEPFSINFNCPTAGANLGVFAAVNIAMLIITPILGRRTVVQKLTFGLLGKPHSQGWMIMGPVTALLHTTANLINAGIIRSTPGYSHVSLGTLVMLWFSRPRLAWLSVVLVVFQSGRAMYLSVAATTLTAEIILQILSVYVMGYVANYSRRQGFYSVGNYGHVIDAVGGRGPDAMVMYGGALLWLVVVAVTIGIVGKAVLDVNIAIGNFKWTGAGGGLGTLKAKKEGKLRDGIVKLSEELDRAKMAASKGLEEAESTERRTRYLGTRTLSDVDAATGRRKLWQELLMVIEGPSHGAAAKNGGYVNGYRGINVHMGDQQGAVDSLIESVEQLKNCANDKEVKYRGAISRLGEGQFAEGRGADEDVVMLTTRQEADDLATSINTLVETQIGILQTIKAQAYREIKRLDPRNYRDMGKASDPLISTMSSSQTIREYFVGHKTDPDVVALMEENKAAWERWNDISHLARELERLWNKRRRLPTGTEWVAQTQSKLRRVAWSTILGMLACWIAQWLFWVGFVRLYTPDGYCPPKLGYMAGTWILFSVIGAPLGASY